MAVQTLFFSSTTSVRTPVASMQQFSLTTGTTNTGTSIASSTNKTLQFIPATAANNTAKTISNVPSSQGWIFETGLPGRYWPGTWTIQTAITTSGIIVGGETGTLEGKVFIVNPGATTVTVVPGQFSGLFTGTATTLTNATVNLTASLNINSFTIVYPDSYVYVELYWVVAGRISTITSALNTNSANSFVQTSFFEEEMATHNSLKLLNIY